MPNLEHYYTDTAYPGDPKQANRQRLYDQYLPEYVIKKPMPILPYVKAEDLIGNQGFANINDPRTSREQDKEHGFFYMGKTGRSQINREKTYYYHQYLSISLWNPSTIFSFISIMGFVAFFAILILYIPITAWIFISGDIHTWHQLGIVILDYFQILVVAAISWKVGNWIAGFLPAKRGRFLNRRTGMLEIPRWFKKPLEIPFTELVPMLSCTRMYKLIYYHPITRRTFGDVAGEYRIDAFLRAAFFEQFMDITKPLPDVPCLEIYRHLDPVTAEHDKATNRNPSFWRDKTKEEIEAIAKERREAMEGIFGGGAFSV